MNNIIKEKLFLHFKSQIKLLECLLLCNLTYKTVRNSMVECMNFHYTLLARLIELRLR